MINRLMERRRSFHRAGAQLKRGFLRIPADSCGFLRILADFWGDLISYLVFMPSASANLDAETAVGSFILTAAATDGDADARSANISYSIDSGGSRQVERLFRMDGASGALELAALLPQEQSVFRFYIVATDDGAPPLQTRVEAAIFVQHSGG